MIELPESYVLAEQINRTLKGKTIMNVEANHTPHAFSWYTERDLFGCPGGYKTILSKNTVDKPCPACGTIIKKEAYMGGSIYYCEGCQRKDGI